MERRVVRLAPTERLFIRSLEGLPSYVQDAILTHRRSLRPELQQRVSQRESRPLMVPQWTLRQVRSRNEPIFAYQSLPMSTDTRPLNVFVAWILVFRVSENQSEKRGMFRYTGPANELRQEVDRIIGQYLANIPELYEIVSVDVRLTDLENRTLPYSYAENRMLAEEPLDLSVNLFSNIVRITPTKENCVKTFLRKQYPKISTLKKDPIGHLGNEEGVSTNELLEFCRHYKIRMVAYNVRREVIAQYTPQVRDKKYASLYFISYNNHIYPIKNRYLETIPKQESFSSCASEELYHRFMELVSSGIAPADIRIHDNAVVSYVHEGTEYFTNSQFGDCNAILTSFGFSDRIRPMMRYTNILYELEKAYGDKSMDSFFPVPHTKLPFWYNKEDVDPKRETETLDKNKAYSSILKNLPYLLTVDYRTTPVEDFPFKLTEHALYIATPDVPCILMPKQDIYSGHHLLYCKGKINFTIQEKLKADFTKNIYADLVPDLFDKCNPDIAKQILVRTIGTFQCEPTAKEGVSAHLVNESERNPQYDAIPYGKYFLELTPHTYVSSLTNRKPIAIQIKDQMNVLLYEKMVELNLAAEDIVQINTDSITFYAKPTLTLKTSTTLDGWKKSAYKVKQGSIFDSAEPFTSFRHTTPNDNTLNLGYAGNGKSYSIQHETDLVDSIILSSKHSAIAQHREKGLNAQVIQYYQFSQTIPVESHIIVEEVGILDRHQWNILFKCFLLGKKITAFGDFQQLVPACETAPFSAPQFLSLMFSRHVKKTTNYRNHFTTDYYDTLIESTDPEYLKQEILRHSTSRPQDAKVIIAYRNSTVKHYNDLMLKYLNKTIEDPDVPLLCRSNELRHKNIFNGFVLLSKDVDPEDRKHFQPAYARTLYNMQGDQTESYYMAPEDIHWFAKPREAYTLISRLSTRK